MTEENDHTKKSQKPKKSKTMLQRFISAAATAFFLGFLVLVIFNAYMWITKGYNKMIENLDNNYQEKIISSLTIQNSSISAYSVAAFELINDKFKKWILNSEKQFQLWQKNNQFGILQNLPTEKTLVKKANCIEGILESAFSSLQKIGFMLWVCFTVLVFKFISIFGALLIYIFASLLGALDGLVTRYIRTAEGGRESTFIFHKLTDVIIQFPIWLIAIYLISPALINPMLIISLLALAFFVVFNIAASNLKKFL